MGFFETIMNLDVELMCASTRAFAAKEESYAERRYSNFVKNNPLPLPKATEQSATEPVSQTESEESEAKKLLDQLIKNESTQTAPITGPIPVTQESLDAALKQQKGNKK